MAYRQAFGGCGHEKMAPSNTLIMSSAFSAICYIETKQLTIRAIADLRTHYE